WGRHYKVATKIKVWGYIIIPHNHPHHITQHGQYSEYELGMTAYNNSEAVMTDYD
ncbi:hypothetical protein A2U01_0118733, partial [Trifolium medium]|nr:hypothetical protein [Trifolium medium]